MKVIFFGNYKGGVGKTASVLNFARLLSPEKKILLLDIDPQNSLSELLMQDEKNGSSLEKLKPEETLNYVFDLQIKNIKQNLGLNLTFELTHLIRNTRLDNLFFIPSSMFYEHSLGLDRLSMRMKPDIRYFAILGNLINQIKKDYADKLDYIFIDCPPTNNVITESAFLISDGYLIPTIVDGMSTNGVTHYIETVNKVYERYLKDDSNNLLYQYYFGTAPKLVGILFTLRRGQVNYDSAVRNLKTSVVKILGKEPFFFEKPTDNFVDIARSVSDHPLDAPYKDSYETIVPELKNRLKDIGL